jgi:hypothetical protein
LSTKAGFARHSLHFFKKKQAPAPPCVPLIFAHAFFLPSEIAQLT